ncbi:hypothetical protein C4D60_Mb05t21200 [Musa balbisiana]|uniref:Uncharacterized protein n=1 Tax=Musa balbisiana TaxID=52838 RepID=A0A4S8JXS0_MUSBA|nr:hypothetical protein C4D60_Mb05t21200 [Musa balbisiana]
MCQVNHRLRHRWTSINRSVYRKANLEFKLTQAGRVTAFILRYSRLPRSSFQFPDRGTPARFLFEISPELLVSAVLLFFWFLSAKEAYLLILCWLERHSSLRASNFDGFWLQGMAATGKRVLLLTDGVAIPLD